MLRPRIRNKSRLLLPHQGGSVNDASCTSASPFSYAELEDKLKQIPPGLTTVMPSAKMFEMVESVSVLCFLILVIRSGEWSPWHGQSIRSFH
ncbi:hypothetical protein CK203_111729 [Vitis vinifera]|uniref:Uncharacterized protein n=1 Tax=Vitis vinifera TaxID=29760 RepID=A0A438FF73_VITVI|nr:hypothetical protein CK203_111729 [Vitis vinifera]